MDIVSYVSLQRGNPWLSAFEIFHNNSCLLKLGGVCLVSLLLLAILGNFSFSNISGISVIFNQYKYHVEFLLIYNTYQNYVEYFKGRMCLKCMMIKKKKKKKENHDGYAIHVGRLR